MKKLNLFDKIHSYIETDIMYQSSKMLKKFENVDTNEYDIKIENIVYEIDENEKTDSFIT